MLLVERLLDAARLSVRDMDAFAVTTGPGSFTGLRIGIASIKGMALAMGKPVCGISSLEALAAPFAACSIPVYPIIDARKHEIYFAAYQSEAGRLSETRPARVGPVSQLMAEVNGPGLFVGSGARAVQDDIRSAIGEMALFVPSGANLINPAVVADLARAHLCGHASDPPDTLSPIYIRPPDAVKSGVKP